MAEFEQRIQLVAESEDEFMLSLVKLYRTANPTASTEDIIEPSRGNFSVEYLLTFATVFLFSVLIHMRPQSHMMPFSKPPGRPNFILSTPVMILYNHLLLLLLPPPLVAEPTFLAINELANKFNQHMALMDQRLSQQEAQLPQMEIQLSPQRPEITCYECGFPNHIACNCTQKN